MPNHHHLQSPVSTTLIDKNCLLVILTWTDAITREFYPGESELPAISLFSTSVHISLFHLTAALYIITSSQPGETDSGMAFEAQTDGVQSVQSTEPQAIYGLSQGVIRTKEH